MSGVFGSDFDRHFEEIIEMFRILSSYVGHQNVEGEIMGSAYSRGRNWDETFGYRYAVRKYEELSERHNLPYEKLLAEKVETIRHEINDPETGEHLGTVVSYSDGRTHKIVNSPKSAKQVEPPSPSVQELFELCSESWEFEDLCKLTKCDPDYRSLHAADYYEVKCGCGKWTSGMSSKKDLLWQEFMEHKFGEAWTEAAKLDAMWTDCFGPAPKIKKPSPVRQTVELLWTGVSKLPIAAVIPIGILFVYLIGIVLIFALGGFG
jgi:hypothetical protein